MQNSLDCVANLFCKVVEHVAPDVPDLVITEFVRLLIVLVQEVGKSLKNFGAKAVSVDGREAVDHHLGLGSPNFNILRGSPARFRVKGCCARVQPFASASGEGCDALDASEVARGDVPEGACGEGPEDPVSASSVETATLVELETSAPLIPHVDPEHGGIHGAEGNRAAEEESPKA